MFPFPFWSPTFRFPLSGDVTQEIEPALSFAHIAGVPEIEREVVTSVASYGTQLGKVLEALQALSAATGTALPEIDALVAEVEVAKLRAKDALKASAAEALARLAAVDPEAAAELRRG